MKGFLLSTFWWIAGLLWVTLAVAIIGVAVIIGLGRVLVPLADHVRPQVEGILSDQSGQPVTIGRLEAEWPGLTPRFTLHDLAVGRTEIEGEGVRMQRASLEFELVDAFRADRNVAQLVLHGLDVLVSQGDDGHWQAGIQPEAGEGDFGLLRLGDVRLRDARLRLQPATLDPHFFHLPELRLQRAGDELAMKGRIQGTDPDAGSFRVRLLAEFDQDRPVRLRGWLGGQLQPAAWPVTANGFLPWVEESEIGLEAWVQWSLDGPARVNARFEASQWPWKCEGTAGLEGRLLAVRDQDSSRFELDGTTLPEETGQAASFRLAGARDRGNWALAVDTLDLAAMHRLVTPWIPDGFEFWPEQIAGTLDNVLLAGDRQGSLHAAEGAVRSLRVSPVQRAPGVRSLDLDISLDGDLLALAPSGAAVAVDWPGMLRESVELQELAGKVVLGRDWVGLKGLAMSNREVTAVADGWISLAGDSPFLDIGVRIPRAEVASLHPYLPVGIMPDEAVAWLDRSLPNGARADGDLRFYGPADAYPWEDGGGEFVGRVNLEWADLNFAPDWPVGRDLAGEINFSGTSLRGRTSQGRITGIDVDASRIRIENLRAPHIDLDFHVARAPLAGLMDFLDRAPLELDTGELDELEFDGSGALDLAIGLPIGRIATGDWTLDGSLDLDGAGVAHSGDWFRLEGLAGPVAFDRNAFGPARLTGQLNGHPVGLSLAGSPGQSARLDLAGQLPVADLLPPGWMDRERIENLAPGASHWTIALSRIEDTMGLEARSELEDTRLELPAPLAKDAAERWPTTLSFDPGSATFGLEIDRRLAAAVSPRGEHWQLGARFGDGPVPVPGPDQAFAITGDVKELDLGGWGRLAGLVDGGGRAGDLGGFAELEVGRLAFGRAYLPEVKLELVRDEQHWILGAAAPAVSGQVRMPAGSAAGRIVVADFQQLHLLLEAPDDEREEPAINELPAADRVDPGNLPALHFLVEDLRYGNLELGRARVEAHPVDAGLEFEHIQTSSDLAEINGRGRWLRVAEGTESTFELRLTSRDLAAFLYAAGYESSLEEGRSRLELAGSWPAGPAAFSLARLTGRLDLLIEDGSIPEASPGGAGRLLGLVSLGSLPRRMQLDFRDVFGQGLSFDRVEGGFDLDAGQARTEEIRVTSPAAEIRISGMTDLIERTYDQEILIQPGLGSTLPVLGMLAAGPGGAVAGLALQGLLGQPLGEMSEIRYRVTGPWEAPRIMVLQARGEDEEIIAPGENH